MKNKRLIPLLIIFFMTTSSSYGSVWDDIGDAAKEVGNSAEKTWNTTTSWSEKQWKKVAAAGGKVGDFFTTPPWGKGYRYTFTNLSNTPVTLSLNYQGHPNNPVKKLKVPAKGKNSYKTDGWNVGYCLQFIGWGSKDFYANKIASAEAIVPLCKDVNYWVHEIKGVGTSWFIPLRDTDLKKGFTSYLGNEGLANAAIGYINAVKSLIRLPETLQKGLGLLYKAEESAQDAIDIGQDLFINVYQSRKQIASDKNKITTKRAPLDKLGYTKDMDDLTLDLDAIDGVLKEIAATLENCSPEGARCALDEVVGKKIKCDKGIICDIVGAFDKVIKSLYEADGEHKLKRDQRKIAAIIGVTTKEGPTADSDEMREAIESEKYSCILFNKNKTLSLPDHMIEGLINMI